MSIQSALQELIEKFSRPDEEIVGEAIEEIRQALAHDVDLGDIRRALREHGFKGDRRKLRRILKKMGVEA